MISKLVNQSDYNTKADSLFAKSDTNESDFVYPRLITGPMHITEFANDMEDKTCEKCVVLVSVFRTDYSD